LQDTISIQGKRFYMEDSGLLNQLLIENIIL